MISFMLYYVLRTSLIDLRSLSIQCMNTILMKPFIIYIYIYHTISAKDDCL